MTKQGKSLNGISFTTEYSYISVLYTGDYLVLDFPFDKQIIAQLKQMPGARFNTLGNKKWTLPKNASGLLKQTFSEKLLSFKSNEEIKKDAHFFTFQEETIDDVLSRIPKQIDTSFMKLPPKNFQKVTMGWVATPKGKRGNVYGGILGDTMGLGKTIQALASAAYLKQQGKVKRCLIVTQAGLKDQWAGETERFTNESYVVIQGNGKKDVSPAEHRRALLKSVRENDIFFTIASYELLAQREVIGEETVIEKGKPKKKQIKGDYTDLSVVLENEYDMIIMDEAQKIRNLNTLVCKAIYEIQSPTYRLIMTGTPIEKEIDNIFPLIDYLSPNIFGDGDLSLQERLKRFEDKFLIKTLNPHALPKRVPEATGLKNLSTLNKLLMPYMLQRTIQDVKDEMPKASVQIEEAGWEDNQLRLYNEVVDTLKEKNDEWSKTFQSENTAFARYEQSKKNGKPDTKTELLYRNLQEKRLLLENEVKALRLYSVEICNTPELLLWSESPIAHRLLSANTFFSKIHKKAQKIRKNTSLTQEEVTDKLHELFAKEVPVVPKLERYLDCIVELCLKNDEKVITFSKFETMAFILEREVKKLFQPKTKKKNSEPLASLFLYTGSTKKGCQWKTKLKKEGIQQEIPPCSECPFIEKCQTRSKSQWHLQNDPFTKVLIATDAANAGVNLQSARYNFNYDLPDSPSRYNQRNGRIQRIGSMHENVFFINMVTAGGIDAYKFKKIMEKQENIDETLQLSEEDKLRISQAAEEMEDDFLDDVSIEEEQELIQSLKPVS